MGMINSDVILSAGTGVKRAKVLCILSTILGHRSAADRLAGALDVSASAEPVYLRVGVEAYADYPAPWWARLTDPWHSEFIGRAAARRFLEQSFDLLFTNTWEFAVAFRDVARRVPAAVILDAVPATMEAQLQKQNPGSWKIRIAGHIHRRAFARAAPAFDLFLPKSSECAQSLQRGYGVPPERCVLALPAQSLNRWIPHPREYAPPARLLFAGNDFTRKGGEFLLRLLERHLANSFTLTIASNDPCLEGRGLPSGVRWIPGLDRARMLPLFQESDIFVFPSRQDFTPEVVAEALAVGLPCVISEIDGAHDLIRDGQNGYVLPRDAAMEIWAQRLLEIVSAPARLAEMSRNARRFAEQNLGSDRFEALIAGVVERLLAMRKGRTPAPPVVRNAWPPVN